MAEDKKNKKPQSATAKKQDSKKAAPSTPKKK